MALIAKNGILITILKKEGDKKNRFCNHGQQSVEVAVESRTDVSEWSVIKENVPSSREGAISLKIWGLMA